jgi:ribonucleoside-diphosphate reductase alpha chain
MNTETPELRADLGLASTPEFPRVIRRDLPGAKSAKPRVVQWIGRKIETAVDAACAAVGHAPVGKELQAEVEFRVRKAYPLFIHVEQLQDLVESLLVELNYGQVALAYAKYRARRAVLRENDAQSAMQAAEQLELSAPSSASDLRLRLSFARIGLHLTLSTEQLVARLMRSVSLSLTPEEQRETIILNAKNLLDLDGDSRFFAGRILLTYIYEETLPWKINDGIDRLKIAHRRAFLDYIPSGIKQRRLDPRLADFRLDELADAIDPYADLQFDFIGIQNLYDRYLIHLNDASRPDGRRRLESPQIFWMRVAMGLAVLEGERETRAKEFYDIYRSRRACSSTPTLFNSGTRRPQLSSCYLLHCGDSIEEIAETWSRFSVLSKWAAPNRICPANLSARMVTW